VVSEITYKRSQVVNSPCPYVSYGISFSLCLEVWFLYCPLYFYLYFFLILHWGQLMGGLNSNIYIVFLLIFTGCYCLFFYLLYNFFILSWLASMVSKIIYKGNQTVSSPCPYVNYRIIENKINRKSTNLEQTTMQVCFKRKTGFIATKTKLNLVCYA